MSKPSNLNSTRTDQSAGLSFRSNKSLKMRLEDELQGSDPMFYCYKQAAKYSFPNILTMLCFYSVQMLTTWYMGKQYSAKHGGDETYLAGIGLGNMMLNVFVFALTQGLNGAVDTFVSQAYGSGPENYHYCGQVLNRARAIAIVSLIPIAVLFYFSDDILIGIGQNAEISTIARNFCVLTLPGVTAMSLFDTQRRYLQCMLLGHISTFCQAIPAAGHIFWLWLFITKLNLGVLGAAIALNTTFCLTFLSQTLYCSIVLRDFLRPLTAPFFTWDTLSEWGPYLRKGIPGTLLQCGEWWAYEFLAIAAGYLGTVELAAEIAIINLVGFVYMIPLGISFTASGLVGTKIGEGNIPQAKKNAIAIAMFDLTLILPVAIFVWSFQPFVASIFTDDEDIIATVQECIPVLGFYLILASLTGVMSGVIRTLGRQDQAAMASIFSYYCIGTPLAMSLAFKYDKGVKGLWIGFCVAISIRVIIMFFIIMCDSWQPVQPKPPVQPTPQSVKSIMLSEYDEDDDNYHKQMDA